MKTIDQIMEESIGKKKGALDSEKNGSGGSERREGNTRPPSSKRWCFTYHVAPKGSNGSYMLPVEFENWLGANGEYYVSYELGEEKSTPHLQGYIEFNRKVRAVGLFDKRIHWEKSRGNRNDNISYISKEGIKIWTNMKLPEKIIDPLENVKLFPFQNEICEMAKTRNDGEIETRFVYWYFEESGNWGKTSLAKHLCIKYNAAYVNGAAKDIKYAVSQLFPFPKIIIFDFTRSQENFISWEGIESVKNGIFFNSKYESTQVIMNSPLVICFANYAPDVEKLSLDRWKIKQIVYGWPCDYSFDKITVNLFNN